MATDELDAGTDLQRFIETSGSIEKWLFLLDSVIGIPVVDPEYTGDQNRMEAGYIASLLKEIDEQINQVEDIILDWNDRIIASDPSGSNCTSRAGDVTGPTAHHCAVILLLNVAESFSRFNRECELPADSVELSDAVLGRFSNWVSSQEKLDAQELRDRSHRERAYVLDRFEADADDSEKKSRNKWPQKKEMRQFCEHLKKNLTRFSTQIDCARDFCVKRKKHPDEAKTLMRTAQRYKHLWNGQ